MGLFGRLYLFFFLGLLACWPPLEPGFGFGRSFDIAPGPGRGPTILG